MVSLAAIAAAWAQPADLILTHAKIVTVDDRFRIAEAAAIRGGRFVAVGNQAEIARFAGPTTRTLDLQGKLVLPGLIDSHLHASAAAMYEFDHPVPEMETIADVLDYVRARAAVSEPGEWIAVTQVFITRLRDQRFPTRAELDQSAPRNPVFFGTGPDASVNTLALKRNGIDRNFRVPTGEPGRVEVDANGEPTGILRKCERWFKVASIGRKPTFEDRRAWLKKLLADYNSVGLTSISERDLDDDDLELYRAMRAAGELTCRVFVNLHLDSQDPIEKLEARVRKAAADPLHKYDNMLWLKGTKMYLDGGMLTGSAYMLKPWGVSKVYSITDPNYRGMRYIEPGKLYQILKLVLQNDMQPTAHSVGDAAVEAMVAAYAEVNNDFPVRPGRPCISHSNFMTPDAIRKMKELGLVADLQPAWLYLDGSTLRRQFGEERTAYFQPYRALFDGGVVGGAGSDHMQKIGSLRSINPYNPFLGIWTVLARQPRWTDAPLHPEQRITREQALRLYTTNNAFLTFEEKEKGSIEPGKLADFIVLDRDILACPLDDIRKIQVEQTWLGGRQVYARAGGPGSERPGTAGGEVLNPRGASMLSAMAQLAQDVPPPSLKVTVTLVQLDAVVTDAHGKHVANLGKDDFRVYQDGVEQKITHFTYVPGLAPAGKPRGGVAPAPASRSKPRLEQTERTIVLMVDDLGLSFASTHFVREALKKYVKEEVQPGDLVAVLRTSGGTGAYQQFTTDPRVLNAAIDRVRWSITSRAGISSMHAWGNADTDAGPTGEKRHRSTLGTLAMLEYVARGLRTLPGRKSVVFFSDGIVFRKPGADIRPQIQERLRRLIDAANRSGVVIYTIDARGLMYPGLQAQDDTGGDQFDPMNPGGLSQAVAKRTDDITDNWDGMIELARQTGGLFFKNTNDLAAATRQAAEDLSGYYLVGYSPSDDTFRPINGRSKYHRTALRVVQPGLRVRTRSGYFGAPEEAVPETQPDSPGAALLHAVLSPFDSGGIGLRLTALFGNAAKTGSYVDAMLHIAGKDLTFTREPGGMRKASVEVASFIYGDDGELMEKRVVAYNIRVAEADYENALRRGFLSIIQHATKKPGAYQVRAAVRDSGSGRLGSASQFIEVPDVEKGALALSGITMQSREDSGSALRIFKPGEPFYYGLVVFNPSLDATTGKPDVEIRARVFRNGEPVWSGPAFTLAGSTPEDPRRVRVAQQLNFGASTPPGEYFLEVSASSAQADGKRRAPVTQWMDFELR